ncbi:hypothetical protein VQ7734_04755 [Vibrio quintilis]|uniref:SMI1 / KNR4 family protein n=2 Tax=Vibrio quintilis TaxID=1117707 RepID=A0A1M7Z2G6_9VIBR|nr:hypothetical protein VQ7734_04755 [Vibrio quintilis]
MSIEKLMTILPVPENNGMDIPDWDEIEKAIQFELPEDYKQFIAVYGLGWIDDFMLVLAPGVDSNCYDLLEGGKSHLLEYIGRRLSHPDFYLHNALENGDGIYPWGITDNVDTLYWQVVDGKVESILIYNKGPAGEFFESKLAFSDFLYAILSKEVVTDHLPEDFPSEEISFVEQWRYDQDAGEERFVFLDDIK